MHSVGSVCDDYSSRPFAECLRSGHCHPVPVATSDVVRPHVTQLASTNPGVRCKFRHGSQEFLWLEAGGDCACRIVYLARNRTTGVEDENDWKRFVLGHSDLVFGHRAGLCDGYHLYRIDRRQWVTDIVAVDQLDGDMGVCARSQQNAFKIDLTVPCASPQAHL